MGDIRTLKWCFFACNIEKEDAKLTKKKLQRTAELFNRRHYFEKVEILKK